MFIILDFHTSEQDPFCLSATVSVIACILVRVMDETDVLPPFHGWPSIKQWSHLNMNILVNMVFKSDPTISAH